MTLFSVTFLVTLAVPYVIAFVYWNSSLVDVGLALRSAFITGVLATVIGPLTQTGRPQ